MIYFLTGGGTAGHIYPAISIGSKIEELDSDAKIYYVGLKGKLEEEISNDMGYDFLPISSMRLYLKPSIKAFKSAFAFIKGVFKSIGYIKKYKPDAVIATGGYVAGPIGYASKIMRVPLFIHESNAIPGITTKFLDRYSKITFLSYEDLKEKFKRKDNKIFSGTPIRDQFLHLKHVENETPVVLTFGGSGGQKKLNDAVSYIFNKYDDLPLKWIHITGRDWEKEFNDSIKKVPKYATLYKYHHELYNLMNESDLVVAGCGAQTLNEISSMKKASILIPKMYVALNHQYLNAKKYVDKGASLIIKEDELTGESLINSILELVNDKNKLRRMGENAESLYVKNSSEIIAKKILEEL